MRRIVTLGTLVAVALLFSPPVFRPHRAAARSGAGTGVPANDVEKSGCCSWHGGVCGCEGNRVQCCDGTLSPSCTC